MADLKGRSYDVFNRETTGFFGDTGIMDKCMKKEVTDGGER